MANSPFASPALDSMGVGDKPDPYAPWTPTSDIGLGGLGQSMADLAITGEQLVKANQFQLPQIKQPPSIAFSPSRNELFVNGMRFGADDAATALEAEPLANAPGTGLPTDTADWVPLSPQAYGQYIDSIRNPSAGRLFKKNFGRGVDALQMIGGGAIQGLGDLFGSEGMQEFGSDIVMKQIADLNKTAPFQREFTEIDSADKAVDWAIATLGQAAPSLLESVAVAVAGAAVGTATGGPAGTFGGAVLGVGAKETIKQQIKAAALKRAQVGWTGLDAAEKAVLKRAAAATYAAGASLASNYAAGFGESYLATDEAGVADPYAALMAAAPYAALESLPEFLLISRYMNQKLPAAAGRGRTALAGDRLKKGVTEGSLGAVAEGLTEAGQQVVTGALAPTLAGGEVAPDLRKQLIESFAAGAITGTAVGGVSGLLRGRARDQQPIPNDKPTNLLALPPKDEPPLLPPPGPEVLGPTPPQGPPPAPALPGAAAPLALTAPTPVLSEVGTPDFIAGMGPGAQVRAGTPIDTQVQVNQNIPPQNVPGSQGVLDIFGGQPVTAAELAARTRPDLTQQLSQPAQIAGPQQLPMIPAQPRTPQQMSLFDRRGVPTAQAVQPQVPAGQRSLFSRRQAPIPPRTAPRQQLQPVPQPVVAVRPTPGEFQRAGQLPLFTQQGEPSVAALRSAGTRQQVVPTVQPGATQIPPTGAPVTPATAAAARTQATRGRKPLTAFEKEAAARYEEIRDPQADPAFNQLSRDQQQTWYEAYRQVKEEEDALQEQSAAALPVQPRTRRGEKVGQEVRRAKEPAGKGKALKQGKAKEQVAPTPPTEPTPPKGGKTVKKAPAKTTEAKATPAPKAAKLQKGPAAKARVAPTPVERPTYATPQEAWDDMRPNEALAYDQIPEEIRAKWDRAVAVNAATMELADQISFDAALEGPIGTTPLERINNAIAEAESAVNLDSFQDAIITIVDHAYVQNDDTNVVEANRAARSFMERTQFTEAQRGVIDSVLLDKVNSRAQIDATYTRGANKGQGKPWFNYAVQRNLLPSVTTKMIGLPNEFRTTPAKKTEEPASTMQSNSANRANQSPEAKLAGFILDLRKRITMIGSKTTKVKFKNQTYANIEVLATELFKEVKNKKYAMGDGTRLGDYFNKEGKPRLIKSDNLIQFINRDLTPEQAKQIEEDQRAAKKALAQETADEYAQAEVERKRMEKEGFKEEADWDSEDGFFYRDNGTPITSTVPIGKIRLIVNAFLSKLKVKPNMFVYRNVADFQASNPELFRKAVAARKRGDFETTKAVGYSFQGNVIIFSDFVRTEQQLKFVLGHETLGHFGFKSMMTRAELEKVFGEIYRKDKTIQAGVDAMMAANPNLELLEAVEEYVADMAAELDVSIMARVWNAIKNILNKVLGIKFGDEEGRYLIGQARKYIRNGEQSNIFTVTELSKGLRAVYDTADEGRFQRYDAGEAFTRGMAANAMNFRHGPASGLLGRLDAWQKKIFGSGKDLRYMYDSLLETVQTLDNKARRSAGLEAIFRLFEQRSQKARALLSKYSRFTEVSHRPDIFGFGKGVTEQEKEQAGVLLANAALFKSRQLTEQFLDSFDPLILRNPDGTINALNLAKVRDQLEQAGTVTAEEFRRGFDIEYSDGNKTRFQFNVDENSNVWKMYQEQRMTVNEAAIDMLLANYETSYAETTRILGDLKGIRGLDRPLSEQDMLTIRKVAELYQKMRYAGSGVANAAVEIQREADKRSDDFVKQFTRGLFNDDTFNDWAKKSGVAERFAQEAEYDDIVAGMTDLRKKINNQQQAFRIQKGVQDLFLFDLQTRNADFYAKRTILGSYVPFSRRGEWQVRIEALDSRGNAVALDENVRDSLPYFQFDSQSDAQPTLEELDNLFGGDKTWNLLDADGKEIEVRLSATISRARQTPDLTESTNFNEFIYVLNRLNINLVPTERERIVTTLTRQNSSARRNLQRSGTPGWDKDIIRSVSEFLETTAHVAAKKMYRHRLDDILLNQRMWKGDPKKLEALKQAVAAAQTDGERTRAKREYEKYAYQYQFMADAGTGRTVNINGKEVPTLGRGTDYQEEAKNLIRWYNDNGNINESTEDMLSGEVGSRLKLLTVLMQLGGSFATAVVNSFSLVTHALPYLSGYNAKTAFGGGYGGSKSFAQLYAAIKDVGNPKFADPAFLNDLAEGRTTETYNLTDDEVQFLFRQTEEGTLQAAQFNALVGTARGKVFNNKAQKAIEVWMSMFSYTEQLNRRSVALATYRMEKERALAQGIPLDQAMVEAANAARTAVNTTQGEYAMFNRPEMARGNIGQYIFMYKQFVIITVQLLKNLPRKEQALALGLLLLMGGVKGLPGADDMMDLYTTLAQKLNWKHANIEKEMTMFFDDIAPGSSQYLMRGVLDRFTGATFSSRVGMGDLLPLTGVFKAGADPAREAENFAGPVFSGLTGLIGTGGSLVNYGAEVLGLRQDTTSFTSIVRESPIAALRSIADGLTYMSDGQITNAQGKVISKDAPTHVVIARMLGFYPASATQQNDIVRLSKQTAEYAKAIKAEYVSAYAKARMAGDNARMEEIKGYVQDWNEDAKGTGLEIRNFVRDATRSAREWERPTALRYLKSAPKGVRPETMELLRALGVDEDVANENATALQ